MSAWQDAYTSGPTSSVDELERRYRAAKEPHERSWWQILWLLARGQLAKDIAESTGYSRYWIGQIAKRYNAEGAEGMRNRQYTHSHRAAPLLSRGAAGGARRAVRGPAPEGDDWTGRLVAEWMSRDARAASQRAGRLGVPRAPGGQATEAAPAACAGRSRAAGRLQKKIRPLVQAVATRLPEAQPSSSGRPTSTASG